MIKRKRLAQSFRAAGQDAVDDYLEQRSKGDQGEEESFYKSFFTVLRRSLNAISTGTVSVRAHYFTRLSEGGTGADVALLIEIRDGDTVVKKGVLLQAKRDDRLEEEWDKLRDQCRNMLKWSSDGFAMVFAVEGVQLLPALEVSRACWREEFARLASAWYKMSFPDFIVEFLKCTIGDPQVNTKLEKLLAEHPPRTVFEVTVTADGRPNGEAATALDDREDYAEVGSTGDGGESSET